MPYYINMSFLLNVQVVERCCHGDSGEPGESAFGISDEKIPAVFSISEIKMNVFNLSSCAQF